VAVVRPCALCTHPCTSMTDGQRRLRHLALPSALASAASHQCAPPTPSENCRAAGRAWFTNLHVLGGGGGKVLAPWWVSIGCCVCSRRRRKQARHPTARLLPCQQPYSICSQAPHPTVSPPADRSTIELLKDRVFGFDSFWVTSVENYEADGVIFKGNVRGKDPATSYAKMNERLQVRARGWGCRRACGGGRLGLGHSTERGGVGDEGGSGGCRACWCMVHNATQARAAAARHGSLLGSPHPASLALTQCCTNRTQHVHACRLSLGTSTRSSC